MIITSDSNLNDWSWLWNIYARSVYPDKNLLDVGVKIILVETMDKSLLRAAFRIVDMDKFMLEKMRRCEDW